MCSIESITTHIPSHEVEEIREYCSPILKYSKLPKSNLPKEELLVLKRVNSKIDIIIVKADKGINYRDELFGL